MLQIHLVNITYSFALMVYIVLSLVLRTVVFV